MESGPEILRQILFGGKIEDKLVGTNLQWVELDWHSERPLIETVDSPGRAGKLKPPEYQIDSRFPKKSELIEKTSRGRLLHYFANHELLAIESMAYTLLKFPDADLNFRLGIFRTLKDEQRHLKAYLSRMNDCGVELGEVPLNLYFWNTLKNMKTPIDYVVQMSLTFEQANLDFALQYAKLFEEEIDDRETATLLREVHDDEVKHVAHGLKWFEIWRDQTVSEFDAYQKCLPFPMTARRAKGGILFSEASRREAGMSETFIESVRVAGGSRGKIPNLFFFNPMCEVETQFDAFPKSLNDKVRDLKPLMLWLASEEDGVELDQKPPLTWLTEMYALRGETPEFILEAGDVNRYIAFDEVRAWGYGESAWKKIDSMPIPIRKKPLFSKTLHREKLFSKTYWKGFLNRSGAIIRTNEALESYLNLNSKISLLLKSDQSTSGRGHQKILPEENVNPSFREKLKRRLKVENAFVIEPYLKKVQDFSVQYELGRDGKVTEFEPRFFEIDSQFQYKGAILGRPTFTPESALGRAWLAVQKGRDQWQADHKKVLEHLKSLHYHGPIGIDCLVYEAEGENLKIESIIEVNARYTMGRVAFEIERAFYKKGLKSGLFRFLGLNELSQTGEKSFQALELSLKNEFKDQFISTTPVSQDTKTWTFAIASPKPDEALIKRFLADHSPGLSPT